jgi:hypothetical protein
MRDSPVVRLGIFDAPIFLAGLAANTARGLARNGRCWAFHLMVAVAGSKTLGWQETARLYIVKRREPLNVGITALFAARPRGFPRDATFVSPNQVWASMAPTDSP